MPSQPSPADARTQAQTRVLQAFGTPDPAAWDALVAAVGTLGPAQPTTEHGAARAPSVDVEVVLNAVIGLMSGGRRSWSIALADLPERLRRLGHDDLADRWAVAKLDALRSFVRRQRDAGRVTITYATLKGSTVTVPRVQRVTKASPKAHQSRWRVLSKGRTWLTPSRKTARPKVTDVTLAEKLIALSDSSNDTNDPHGRHYYAPLTREVVDELCGGKKNSGRRELERLATLKLVSVLQVTMLRADGRGKLGKREHVGFVVLEPYMGKRDRVYVDGLAVVAELPPFASGTDRATPPAGLRKSRYNSGRQVGTTPAPLETATQTPLAAENPKVADLRGGRKPATTRVDVGHVSRLPLPGRSLREAEAERRDRRADARASSSFSAEQRIPSSAAKQGEHEPRELNRARVLNALAALGIGHLEPEELTAMTEDEFIDVWFDISRTRRNEAVWEKVVAYRTATRSCPIRLEKAMEFVSSMRRSA